MKRSLAPPRRDKPTGGDGNASTKKIQVKPSQDRSAIAQKSSSIPAAQMDIQDRAISQKFEERYRNKNLNILPTQMLVALSTLSTLDISYNQLTDSQIELIMNSCTKLSTFCIQGNVTNLIPASVSKLKLLVNFRHDWVKLNPDDMYQPEKRLQKIKELPRKPELMSKVNKITGIDFLSYCQFVLEIPFDQKLHQKIQRCQCSSHAKSTMMTGFDEGRKGNLRKLLPISQNQQKKNQHTSLSKAKQINNFKRQTINHQFTRQILSETATTLPGKSKDSFQIVIPEKREIEKSPNKIDPYIQENMIYFAPGLPLHNLFANFDRNHYAPAQIDGLLLRGYNPNLYDSNGLSPYHLCIIQQQRKGLEYMLQISSNNPGFFDLQMPSTKEGRNILHFSVVYRNYVFTKMLMQFGIPVDKRDADGARLIHLAGQNIQFLILLRKLLRKRTNVARSLSALTIPQIPHQNKKNYIKHPQRQKQQSRFRITYSRNDKLLEMFETAAGVPNFKM